ncbi:MAG TPA: hypothetical protein VIL46_18515 [Gemmataceae bacterium]
MRRIFAGLGLVVALAVAGCSSDGPDPTTPKLSEQRIKEIMKKGEADIMKERGGKGGGKAGGNRPPVR